MKRMTGAATAPPVRLQEAPGAAYNVIEAPEWRKEENNMASGTGCIVVDIGGRESHIAVLRQGRVVARRKVAVTKRDLDAAMIHCLASKHGLQIGPKTARALRAELDSSVCRGRRAFRCVTGRDLATNVPRTVRLSSADVRTAMDGPVERIVRVIRQFLHKRGRRPPALARPPHVVVVGETASAHVLVAGTGGKVGQECE